MRRRRRGRRRAAARRRDRRRSWVDPGRGAEGAPDGREPAEDAQAAPDRDEHLPRERGASCHGSMPASSDGGPARRCRRGLGPVRRGRPSRCVPEGRGRADAVVSSVRRDVGVELPRRHEDDRRRREDAEAQHGGRSRADEDASSTGDGARVGGSGSTVRGPAGAGPAGDLGTLTSSSCARRAVRPGRGLLDREHLPLVRHAFEVVTASVVEDDAEPTTRSRTVPVTSTSPGPAMASTVTRCGRPGRRCRRRAAPLRRRAGRPAAVGRRRPPSPPWPRRSAPPARASRNGPGSRRPSS